MKEWIQSEVRVYWGNASTVRDFRSQMRGWKAIWTWLAYVLLLGVIGSIAFWGAVNQSETISIIDAQQKLQQFGQMIFYMLNVVILLVAPAMISSSICVEYDRKSIDLIQSAPVTPRYFLIGKVLGAYRNIVMLLILALPVTAMSVVVGGSTWFEVIEEFFLLSLQGVLAMAVAIPLAVATKKTITAVVGTYASLFVISMGLSAAMAAILFRPFLGMGSSSEAPFIASVVPFAFVRQAHTITSFGHFECPNSILAALFMGWVLYLAISAAASTLSGYHAREVYWFRIQSLVSVAVLSSLVYSLTAGSALFTGGIVSAKIMPVLPDGVFVAQAFFNVMFLAISAAWFVPYSLASDRKKFANRILDLQEVFGGTPAGSLLYGWLLVLCADVPILIYPGAAKSPFFLPVLAWTFATWFLIWSLCWFASGKGGIPNYVTRKSQAILVLVILVPLAVLGFLTGVGMSQGSPRNLLEVHPLYVFTDSAPNIWLKAALILVVSIVVAILAEARRKALERSLLELGWTL